MIRLLRASEDRVQRATLRAEGSLEGASSLAEPPLPPFPSPPPSPRRSTPLHRVLLLVAAFLILMVVTVPTAVIYYVTFTQSGLQLIVSLIPRRIGDVRLQIDNITGTIAHGIRADAVDVDERVVHVRVEGLVGRVALAPLLWQTIRSPDSFARHVLIEIKPHPLPPTHRIPPMFLPRWLVINLEHARVGRTTLVQADGSRLEASDVEGAALLRHRTIRFYEAQFELGHTHFSGIGVLRAANPLQLNVDARIHFIPSSPRVPGWLIAGTARGDLSSLAITAHTLAPFRSDFTGRALSLTNRRWRWLGNATVHDFDLAAWHAKGPLGVITGQLHLQGDAQGFTADGTALPLGLHAGLFDVQFDGWYANHVLTARHMMVRHRGSGAEATGSGTFGIVRNGPLLDLHGSWRDFRWPLTRADARFHSSRADFSFQGLMPYHVHASGIAKVGDLPASPMQIDGTLGHGGFKLAQGEVDMFQGHATATGSVTWSPERTWSVSGEVEGLNPADFRADLPGRVGFMISAQGRGFTSRSDLRVEVHNLNGQLRGVPASGDGMFARQGRTWRFENLHLSAGGTQLALDGQMAEQMDLRFSLTSQDLSVISAGSRGQVQAEGTIRGTPEVPVINAMMHGTGLRHGGISLKELDGSINFDPHPSQQSQAQIQLHELKFRKRTLQSFSLTLSGRPDHYALRSELKAVGLTATARAAGSYAHGLFTGQLAGLTVNSKGALHLQLARPVGLQLSPERARLQWLCLKGTPVSVCADGDWTPAQWSTTLTASQLPIEALTSASSATGVTYQGTIKILARLFGNGQDPVEGTVRAELTDAQLSHTLVSGRVEHTTIGSGIITATAARTAISATANLQDGQIGTLQAKVVAQRGAPQWKDMPVEGQLHAQTQELGLISLYEPDIDRASGRLTADAQISGTLGTPFLGGQLKVEDAELDLYQVNLRLRQLGLTAHLTDNGLDFTGQAHVGAGTMQANGHLTWRDSMPYGQLELSGQNLRVVDVPEAHIDASPRLQFNIAQHRVDVSGTVDVPYAKLTPEDLTGAVRTSSDEVIVGSGSQDVTRRFEVRSSINLHLGDHVSIATSGLTARLTGDIAVKSGYGAVTRATGELSVHEGKYVAYAHNFDIQRGTLIFTGGPVDNPGVDIRAARKFPDVTAGVNVQGTLLQPRISFFSEPSLPQSEIVSLILSGGSLESAQNRDRQGGAGSEALVQGGAVLLQELGSHLGIEDVGVQANQYIPNDTSLVLGKYLSPRLYVSYGLSLTEELQVLKLRYSLGDHWTLNTEVGQARGADLEFSIDR